MVENKPQSSMTTCFPSPEFGHTMPTKETLCSYFVFFYLFRKVSVGYQHIFYRIQVEFHCKYKMLWLYVATTEVQHWGMTHRVVSEYPSLSLR